MCFRFIFTVFNLKSILLLILCIEGSKTESLVNIHIKPKQFTGLSKQIDGKQVNIFLGIPYAKPPVGELRFRKPVPITQYPGPIVATKWANPCRQSPVVLQTVFKPLINNTNFSEDCLYLNIWAPVDSVEQVPELKPVVVWIHGGKFYAGAANTEQTEGTILSATTDVVVVTFNYRLGWFGFLYAGSDEAPGNMGLWDQVLALKWVNENIMYFGGNPDRITIMGEGAGSQSVSLHLLSPISRNLFRGAIMISGGPIADIFKDTTSAKKMWSNIGADFGCEQDFLNGSVQCLRSVNAEKLIESAFDKRYKTDINIIKPFVIFGDEFLPRKPSEMLALGDFKKNVRLLVGTTVDEGSYVLTTSIDTQRYSLISPHNMTKSEAMVELKAIFRRFFPNIPLNSTDDIYRLYVSQLPDADYKLILQSMGVALGDYIRTCPTVLFAKQLYSRDRDVNRVYQYLWSAKYDNSWHGSEHGIDVGFFFGQPYRQALTNNESILNEKRISMKAMQTIAHFARFGQPPTQEGIEWQSYYTIDDKVINPYFEFTKRYFTASDFSTGYKYECEYFWHKYITNK